MPRALPSLTSKFPLSNSWRAGNPARSRLSGGSVPISTRPPKLLRTASQPSLNRILLDIIADPIKLCVGSDQTIKAFLLPKRSMSTEHKIGLMACESLQWTQPFGGKNVRCDQEMHVIRHHDERMELIPLQFAVSVPQSRHHHFRNFFAPQERRAISACVQQPVDSYECLARRYQCGWREHPAAGKTAMQSERDKQGLVDRIPMGQPPFIMPHTSMWCAGDRETLTAPSRLKAGCGQDCPPSNLFFGSGGVA
jgi:hypothetical protein